MSAMTGSEDEAEAVRSEAVDWLLRIQASPEDPAIRQGLESWLAAGEAHRHAFSRVEMMWGLSTELPSDYAERVHAAGTVPTLRQETAHRPASGRRPAAGKRSIRRRVLAFSAAALAACIAVAVFPSARLYLQADHVTGTGEVREITLEDGSTVHLDAESALAVHYTPLRREVSLLAGAAFFQVVKNAGRPFVVAAANVRTTVTGTSFEVRLDPDEIDVTLESGAVDVTLAEGEARARLAPGERLSIEQATGRFSKSTGQTSDIAAWRSGRLSVDGASMAEVVRELSRYHRGLIVLDDPILAERRVTGTFDLGHPIEALQAVVRSQKGDIRQLTPFLLVVTGAEE